MELPPSQEELFINHSYFSVSGISSAKNYHHSGSLSETLRTSSKTGKATEHYSFHPSNASKNSLDFSQIASIKIKQMLVKPSNQIDLKEA